jgi:hypothetical protein
LAIPKKLSHSPAHVRVFTRYRQIGDNLPATLAVHSIEPPLSRAVSGSTPLQQQMRLPAPRIMQSGLTGEPAEHAIRNRRHGAHRGCEFRLAHPLPLPLQLNRSFPK